jgi:hypothetical protein
MGSAVELRDSWVGMLASFGAGQGVKELVRLMVPVLIVYGL